MQELAPERNKLVIGIGGTTAQHTGLRSATRDQMREAIPVLRKLLKGESVPFGISDAERIEDPDSKDPIIQLAASGPQSIKLAAEIADGVLVFIGIENSIRDSAIELIESELKRVGKPFSNFEITFNTLLSVDHDESIALERTRNAAHNWLKLGRFNFGLSALGISPNIPNDARELDMETLSTIAENFFIVGTPQKCIEKIKDLSFQGIGRLLLMDAAGNNQSDDLFFKVLKEIILESKID